MSTAYDVYLLAKAAVKDKRISEWASEEELVLMNPRGEQVVYNNRNNFHYFDSSFEMIYIRIIYLL